MFCFKVAFYFNLNATTQKVKLHQLNSKGRNKSDLKMDAADSFKEQHVAITFHFRGREGFLERNRDGEQRGEGGCDKKRLGDLF